MEQIIAQAAQQALQGAVPLGTGRTGRSALAAQAGGDPFMQIIQNMVDQMLEGKKEEAGEAEQGMVDQALLAGFAGMLFAAPTMGLPEATLEEGTLQADALLQQLAMQTQGTQRHTTMPEAVRQLLMQSMGRTEQFRGGEEAVSTDNRSNVDTVNRQTSATAPPMMQTTQATAQTEALATQSGVVQTQADLRMEQRSQTRTFLQSLGTEKLSQEELTQSQTEVVSTQSQNRESDSLFDGQQRFGGAVAQAKQMLQGQSRKGETAENEPVELLQMSQKVQLPTANTVAKPSESQNTQTPSLLDQLSDGLTQELGAGKSEFTMKLKPEALGEITVKLTEKAGKMVVSITTASAQTAKLLNTEMPALRETMRPMQVEVHEAVSQSAESNQAQMQFNMSGQQFANQQRAFAWQQQEKPYYAGSGGGDALTEAELDAAQHTRGPESAGLNLYV